jgi:hypothetical protein
MAMTLLLPLVLALSLDGGVPGDAGALELQQPHLGQSAERPGEIGQPHARHLMPELPLATGPAPPIEERRGARWLLIGGGTLVIVALALTMGKRRPPDDERGDPR